MHGLIFAELKKFVDTKNLGFTWQDLLADAALGSKIYMPIQEYPDSEVVSLVVAASKRTGLSVDAVLQAFGEFITPDLLKLYGHLARPGWKTLDFIEHAEETIHSVVRVKNPGAKPPMLRCTRVSDGQILVHYNSQRRMCGVAKGIIKGLAAHYNDRVVISESKCMHNGAAACEISVVTASAASSARA